MPGQTLVIMLGGGDKSTPSKDIRQAIEPKPGSWPLASAGKT